eukprot:CAMPEP_0116015310 /NCGR_PEP_ID=MMETSP0321-20121206/6767_1 /TAXON_ID=163516 /ORGANISM="Leptocylindrus danicus var. danicus, Strain B650" /LENGTH=440 /DNA_ID=CAMNT_0003485069 /DNA_START=28 /DNA_END=1350 /DNA_ORIENTATION=+
MGSDVAGPSPLVLWSALFVGALTCSSAGVVFDELTSQGVPPFLAASWRLWCQSIILIIPFVLTYQEVKRNDAEIIKHWITSSELTLAENELDEYMRLSASTGNLRNNVDDLALIIPRFYSALPLMICSGMFLGIHFSSWVYSVQTTSLAHSLTWVSMGPIIICWGQWILYICRSLCCSIFGNVKRPSWKETLGSIVGLSGAIMMLGDVAKFSSSPTAQASLQHEPTMKGDLAAFVGAFAVSIYLVIGRNCRSWMPLWLYIFPVVVSSALSSLILALFDSEQPTQWSGLSQTSVFGFLNVHYLPYAMYLGIGPGIAGHTVFNALLKYMSPLIISTAMLSEPLFGSVLGYICGMQQIPGLWTLLGGIVLLVSLFFVSYNKEEEDERDSDQDNLLERTERQNEFSDKQMTAAVGDDSSGMMATVFDKDDVPLKKETIHGYGTI